MSSAPRAVEETAVAPSGEILQATGVSVSFGGLRAVVDVDLSVKYGEVVAVIGPNGAGKTTLLNAISGLVSMTGALLIEGRQPRAIRPRILAGLGLARSFQAPQLIEQENAIENVACGAHLRAGYTSWDQVFRRRRVYRRERILVEEARSLLLQAGLSESEINRPVSSLTHGTRKRVDIARALMSHPKLLLMDEPTSGMGTEERELVEEMVRTIQRNLGAAILMVEHHMDVVRSIADRAIAMQTGSVLKVGSVRDVLESEEFVIASLGRAAAESLHQTNVGGDLPRDLDASPADNGSGAGLGQGEG